MSASPLRGERPYRSHLRPACIPCRKRKSRCKIDAAEASGCLMCRQNGTECKFPGAQEEARAPRAIRGNRQRARQATASSVPDSNLRQDAVETQQAAHARSQLDVTRSTLNPREQRYPARAIPLSTLPETPFSNTAVPFGGGEEESHVIGPVLSPDTQLITNYLSNNPTGDGGVAQLVRPPPGESAAGLKPIMFSAVRRRPLGTSVSQTTAALKCQMIEKLIDPFCTDLIDLLVSPTHAGKDSISKLTRPDISIRFTNVFRF